MTAKEFVDLLEQHCYDFFAGVPCSLLEGVLAAPEIRDRFRAALGAG